MSVNNDVYQVLVGASVNTQVTNNKIENLNDNEIGMFQDEVYPGRLYFAAKNGDDVTFSPQFNINPKKIKAISAKQARLGQTEVQYLNGFMPDVTEKEIELGKILQIFGIKVQAENKKLMKILGLGAYTKTFFSDKKCFDMSAQIFQDGGNLKTGTELVDAYRLYKKYAVLISLWETINKNEDDYFTAYFAQGASPLTGEEVCGKRDDLTPYTFSAETFVDMVDELAALDSTNEVFLCIESKPIAKKNFCSINMHYYKDRFTSLKVSLIEGFCCGAEMIVYRNPYSSVGEGYDVRYREYRAGGWNGRPGPYRTYAVTGLAKEEIVYHADVNTNYDLFSITYEIERIAGWLDHRSWVTVEIAVETDTCVGTFEPDWLTELMEMCTCPDFTYTVDCCALCND